MSISLNPFDLVKLIREHKGQSRKEFTEWLGEVQKQARALLDVWGKMREGLDSSNESVMAEAFSTIYYQFGPQALHSTYLREFYDYASTTAAGRLTDRVMSDLVYTMSVAICTRNSVRGEMEDFLREEQAKKLIFYLDDQNKMERLDTLRNAIDALQRELVSLDVLIETIKSNPKAYR